MLKPNEPPRGSRAIILARFSSDLQNPLSADDQIRAGRAECARRGWLVVMEQKDEAKSGRTVANRPGYLAAMAAIEAGEADVLVATTLDRIGRNARELHDAKNRLADANAVIFTLDRGVMARLEFSIFAEMAQMESEKIAQRVSFGHRAAAGRGKVMGDIPYGYRAVYDERGRTVEIEPVTSLVVVRVHRDYAAGMSPIAIAAALTREGVPSPEGKPVWSPNTILGTKRSGNGILRNPIYVGQMIFGKTTVLLNPKTGKFIKRKALAENMVVTDMPHLRILPDDLWQEVQDILKSRSTAYPRESRRPDYLLSGLTKCGVCDGAYAMTTAKLGCVNRRVGACTNSRRVDRRDVERIVLNGLRNRIVRSPIIDFFLPEYLKELEKASKEAASADVIRDARLVELDKEIANVIKQVRSGATGFAAQLLNEGLEALGQEKERLQRQLRNRVPPSPASLTPDEAINKLQGLLDELGEASLGDERDGARARDLIRSMVTKVVVTPLEEEGTSDGRGCGSVVVDVEGSMSALLERAVLSRKTLHSPSNADMQGLPKMGYRFRSVLSLARRPSQRMLELRDDADLVETLLMSEPRPFRFREIVGALAAAPGFAELTEDAQERRTQAAMRALRSSDRARSLGAAQAGWVWQGHPPPSDAVSSPRDHVTPDARVAPAHRTD